MVRTLAEIAARMDALDIWAQIVPFHWAIKPCGSAVPYFCTMFLEPRGRVKVRFLLLEGWQTLHDYVRFTLDPAFGYYSSPVEMPHFELLVLRTGAAKLFRHDPGLLPHELSDGEDELARRVLWEAYGVMLRLEVDHSLPLKFASEKAMFARYEVSPGKWEDRPLEIPDARAMVEKIEFSAEDIKKAKDLPFASGWALELDFRLLADRAVQDKRPKSVYALLAADAESGQPVVFSQTAVVPDSGLKGMWESMPGKLIKCFLELGRVPGELKIVSPRVFRMLRPICLELPVKLSMHDSLPQLEAAFKACSGAEKQIEEV